MSSPRSMPKQRVLVGLGFALSGIALYYFLRRVDGQQLLDRSRIRQPVDSVDLCVDQGSCLVSQRHANADPPPSASPVPVLESFLAWLSGYVTDNLLPFRLGELVRIDLLARAGRNLP